MELKWQGVKIFSQTVKGFSFFHITFSTNLKIKKLHLFNSHKLVSRPRPRTFNTKTKTETLGIKTETKTKNLKIGSRDVSRPRLKYREVCHQVTCLTTWTQIPCAALTTINHGHNSSKTHQDYCNMKWQIPLPITQGLHSNSVCEKELPGHTPTQLLLNHITPFYHIY